MEALVGTALIEIRATWENVGADTRAALAEVLAQAQAAEAQIATQVGASVAQVEAGSVSMAEAVKSSTDAVGIAWVDAATASSEFAVTQGEISAAIRGATIDAQSLAAGTDGLVAGFVEASTAGQTFATTTAEMRVEMAAVAASEEEAFGSMFAGFATSAEQMKAQIAAAIEQEKALAAGTTDLASRIEILDGATQSEAGTVAKLGTSMDGAAASVERITLSSEGYANAIVTLIERDEALGFAVADLMARYEGLDIATATHIAQNRGVASSEAAVIDALSSEILAVQAVSREVVKEEATFANLSATLSLVAKQEQGLADITAARARALGVATLSEEEATAVSNAYTASLERQFAATGRTTNVTGAMKSALASLSPELKNVSGASDSATRGATSAADSFENAAVKFNFLTRTIRNTIFIITGVEAAFGAVTVKMAEQENKLYNLSQQFGIASSEISGFALLSQTTGESIDTINTSLRQLQKGFAGVGDGSKLAQSAFAALGIQTATTGATARDTASIFKQVADVMSLIPDGEQKIAAGTALMGRSFNSVIPLVNQGAQGFERMIQTSRELGTELTTLDLLVGREIVSSWTNFKGALQGVGFSIERELAPAIISVISQTTEWIAKNRDLIATDIAKFVRTAGSAFGDTVKFIADNVKTLESLAITIGEVTVAYKLLGTYQGLVAASSIGAFLGATSTQFAGLGAVVTQTIGQSSLGGFLSIIGTPIVGALTVLSGVLLQGINWFKNYAQSAEDATKYVRDFQAQLNALTPAQRAADHGALSLEASIKADNVAIAQATDRLAVLAEHGVTSGLEFDSLTRSIKADTESLHQHQTALEAVTRGNRETTSATSTLTAESHEQQIQMGLLQSAVRNLSAGLTLEAGQVAAVEKATSTSLPALEQMFKEKKLNTTAAEGLSKALGIEVDVIQRTIAQTGNLAIGEDKAGKAAAAAAKQLDSFNAAAAKNEADTLTKQVQTLAEQLKQIPLPEAIEQLPDLLSLNDRALEANVKSIQSQTEAKLIGVKNSANYNAAIEVETQQIAKAIEEHDAQAQKLILTVTHTKSASEATQAYTQSLAQLNQAEDALKIQVIDDQIKEITDSWKKLDVATRQSQLPQVLSLLSEKYKILGEKADEADKKLLAAAQAQVDGTQAAVAAAAATGNVSLELALLDQLYSANIELANLQAQATQNHALRSQDLAFKLDQESKAAKDAADGTSDLVKIQEVAGQVTDDFAKALVDLAVSGGSAEDALKALGSAVLNDLTSSLTSGFGSMLKAGLENVANGIAGSIAETIEPELAKGAGKAGMKGGELLANMMGEGLSSMMPDAIVGALGAGGTAVAIVAGVAGIGVGIAAAFGAFESPDIQQQIARMLSKQIKKSFGDPEVFSAIDAGLESVGLYLSDGLGTLMVKAPKRLGLEVGEAYAALGKDLSYQFSDGFYQDMKEHGTQLIHSSIADVLHVFYSDITTEVEIGIQQSAVAAGTAIAAEMGLVGDKAIKFAQQWAIAFIGMMEQAGKGADEILVALHRIDSSLGTSQEMVASLQRLQAAMIDAGVDMDALYSKINEQLKLITGKKVTVGNLDEVLAAVGGDATRALGVIENAMDLAGVSVEQFTGQLSDVVLALSDDAGTAIKEAGQDFKDFGNEADGTADILRQNVLTALESVIKTAEELDYSTESIDAFKTAISLIPPEMLKSSEFAGQLADDIAQMAVASHQSVQELVDSIDPPLPAAMRNAILGAHELGVAIGALAGAPLSSLKEVTDRMKQFADDIYTMTEENGEQVKKATAFGEQLIGDTVSAINGMWDTIAKDGQASYDEIYSVFEQLAQIPIETFGDPAIQSAIQSLLAKIGEQTGDAYIIALSALPEVTKDQLDQALAEYEQWKQDVEANPPEVTPVVNTPANPDGSPASPGAPAPSGPDTTPAATTPPPAPIPPETLQSWTDITTAATNYATAVVQGTDAVAALSQGTVTAAATMLEALRPIYGAADDSQSLSAIHELLRIITDDLLGWSGNWADDFDKVRGAVINLTTEIGAYASALATIPSDITTTVTTKYVTENKPPDTPPPGMASGGWIPGAPSDPYPITAHGGELVVPAATAATLPPNLVSQLLSGSAFSLPSSMASRLSYPVSVPMTSPASAQSAPASPAPASPAPGWTMVPVREETIQDGALVRLERAMRDGYAWMNEQNRFEVHTAIKARARGTR